MWRKLFNNLPRRQSVSKALKIQPASHETTPAVVKTLEFLDAIEPQMAHTTTHSLRYGDPGFRIWLTELRPKARGVLELICSTIDFEPIVDFFANILTGANRVSKFTEPS